MKFDSTCKLCNALKNEKDKYLYEDNDIVILPTKTKKGHHKRIMIISKDHNMNNDNLATKFFLIDFVDFCKDYFNEEPTFTLVESTYASIPNHWHRIACDWFGTPKEIKQLHYTPHQSISTNKEWEH